MREVMILLGGIAYVVPPRDLGQRRRLDRARVERLFRISPEGRKALAALPGADGSQPVILSDADQSMLALGTVDERYDLVEIALETARPKPLKSNAITATAEEFAVAYAALEAQDREDNAILGEAQAPPSSTTEATAGATSTAS